MKFALSFLILLFVNKPFEDCGYYRNKKKTNALFQDIRVVKLNCDKTFSFKHSNCTHPEISEGIWVRQKDSIVLFTNNKIRKLSGKEIKTETGYYYLDLTNEKMLLEDSTLIWKRRDKFWTDTLIKQ